MIAKTQFAFGLCKHNAIRYLNENKCIYFIEIHNSVLVSILMLECVSLLYFSNLLFSIRHGLFTFSKN